MHEEKSRGSGLESRKTRFGVTGGVTREGGSRGSSRENGSARSLRSRHDARVFDDFWLNSNRVVTGIQGGFPAILASFGLGKGWTGDLSRRPWGEATADCGRAELGGVEPWLGVEPRLDGLAWLSCGSHSIKRKAGKRLRLDWTRIRSPIFVGRCLLPLKRPSGNPVEFRMVVWSLSHGLDGPWVPKLKFFVEGKLITVNGEEDYAIYKETAVPYVSIGENQNLPFHSFDTVSAIRDYGEVGPSRADRMIGKVLLKSDYIPGTGLGAHAQGILHPVQVEEYRNRRGLDFRPSCHEIVQARRDKHLYRLAVHYGKLSRGIPVPPLSQFFSGPPLVVGGTSDDIPTESEDSSPDMIDAPFVLSDVYAIIEETSSRAPIRLAQENQGLNNWTAIPSYSVVVADAVCIDYRDLNRASPKDNFPLPHIDVLVDNTARHTEFSFMDGFSGYNQIQMAKEDKVKTTFITMWGTFCYKVMPFGLKNAGATYQRAMVTLFHDMMHKEIEIYVNDMIAKSKEGEDHLVNLKRLFDRLKKYKFQLNPVKCTFGVKSGKLLGFIVSEKGIEVDPDKVKAIMELPPPSTVREVRSFLGRLNYIAHFIANLMDKCQPLFRLLRKNAAVEWDDECQKAFDTLWNLEFRLAII
ncbi:hypothetical protein CRG98_008167 [Punica granatum]|uniref:G-patch domain-containing protein n=1 Tax=Punica granatum TaxID=22663 RepID=A0A2I0KSW3_PUNGR|nr:hypothetical protein CRG98_008167 [Punica granatum]